MEKMLFTDKEKTTVMEQLSRLKETLGDLLLPDDEAKIHLLIEEALRNDQIQLNVFGLNPMVFGLQTAQIAIDEIGLKREGVLAIIIYSCQISEHRSTEEIASMFGEGVAHIIHGLQRIQQLYMKSPSVESENFRNLLISFAEDMRVILIMIADRVNLMRQIRDTDREEEKRQVSEEASYLYAPLAHKLVLYKLKIELEDLSLKYLEHDAYYMI